MKADVAPELESVCMKALAHSPSARYGSAGALRADLVRAMAALGMAPSLEDGGRLVSDAFGLERAELREARASRLRHHAEADHTGATSSYPPALLGIPTPVPTPLELGTSTKSAHIPGDIESDATLTCDRDYLLEFNVLVRPGVTLAIAPGNRRERRLRWSAQ